MSVASLDRPEINAETDTLVRVVDIARQRTGRRPSPTTIWRWCRRGCRGIPLPVVMLGASWHTTAEAWSWWINAQTVDAFKTDATDDAPPVRSAATSAKLRAAGLID